MQATPAPRAEAVEWLESDLEKARKALDDLVVDRRRLMAALSEARKTLREVRNEVARVQVRLEGAEARRLDQLPPDRRAQEMSRQLAEAAAESRQCDERRSAIAAQRAAADAEAATRKRNTRHIQDELKSCLRVSN